MSKSSRSSSSSQRAQAWIQWVLLGVGGLFFFGGILLAVGIPTIPFGGLAADGDAASSTPTIETTQAPESTASSTKSTRSTTTQQPTESTTATTTSEQTKTTSPTPSAPANQTNNTTNSSANVAYRINVGGPTLSNGSGPAWTADTANNPSSYLNSRESDTVVQSTPDNITTDGNIPPGVPDAVFKTYRFDRANNRQAEEMVWRFPVEQNMNYEVRLYVVEAYFTSGDSGREYEEPYSKGGPRTFGIEINGEEIRSNYEPFEEHGHDVGGMQSFEVTAENGMIEIRFLREVENPTVSGIEIVETGANDENQN